MSKYKNYFYELESYISKKYNVKVSLTYNTQDFWFPKLKLIMINKDNQWRERYFSLLHESGHVILDMGSMTTKYMKMESDIKESIMIGDDYLVDIIGAEKIAESYSKIMTADFVVSLSRKIEDKLAGTGRWHVIKNRFGPDGMTFPSKANMSNGQMQIYESNSVQGQETQKDMNNHNEYLRKILKNKYKELDKDNKS